MTCVLLVTLLVGLGFTVGCGSGSSGGTLPKPISVTITNKFTTIQNGAAAVTLTATVVNDPANKGVTWSLTIGGAPCLCGQFSNVTATSVTYTPFVNNTSPPFSTPTIIATSVSDTTKSDADSFSIVSPTVVITNQINAITAGGSAITFNAAVQNDPGSTGVIWSLLGNTNNTDCTPTCGTLSNATPTSVIYTPPVSVPTPPNNRPQLIANAVGVAVGTEDIFNVISGPVSNCTGTPTGKESMLKGQYAMFAQGGSVLGASFAPDGTGKITDLGGGIGGAFDMNNGLNTSANLTILPSGSGGTGSFYRLGPDPGGAGNLGCLQIVTSGGTTSIFRFTVGDVTNGVAASGRIIEDDDQSGNGSGIRVTGVLRQQDPSAFSTSDTAQLQAHYAYGWDGVGRTASAGVFTLNPATGSVTFDASNGVINPNQLGLASGIGQVSAKTGRGVFSFEGGSSVGAFYILNANELFLVNLDVPQICVQFCPTTIYAGRAIATGNSFTSASLSGNFILHLNGFGNCVIIPAAACGANAELGVITLTPQGSAGGTTSGSLFTYNSQAGTGNLNLAGGQYAVDAATGQVTLSPSSFPGRVLPILYLTTPASNTENIVAFAVGSATDPSLYFGLVEPGAAQSVATSSLAGSYFFADEDPADPSITNRVGLMSINASGAVTGTELDSSATGLQTQAVNRTLNIDDAAGPGTGNVGPNTFAVTDGGKIFFIDAANKTPASITVVEHQ